MPKSGPVNSMADEPIKPDWVAMPGDRSRPESTSKAAGRRRGGGRSHKNSQKRQPRDVPIAPGEDEILDDAIEVRRFAGLGNRVLSVLIPGVIVGLGVLAALVAFGGGKGLLDSAGGTANEMSAPIPVAPSETLLMVWLDDSGSMVSASLLGRTAGPDPAERPATSTIVFSADSRFASDRLPLRTLFETGGEMAIATEVATIFNTAVDDVAVIDAGDFAQLAADLGQPLTVSIAEPLLRSDGDGSAIPAFDAGDQSLVGADVARFISLLGPAEDRRNHLGRQRDLWDAIRVAMPADGLELSTTDGGLTAEVGSWLSGLGTTRSQVFFAETDRSSGPGQIPLLEVDAVETRNRVASVVPNPRAAPGQVRPAVRLLDATGDDAAMNALRRQIVVLGGRTVSFGAHPESDATVSRVVLHSGASVDEGSAAATLSDVLADALNTKTETDFAPDSAVFAGPFDFTVVVGVDPVQDGGE